MKILIYLCFIPLIQSCAHFKESRIREVNRNYVFGIGEMSQPWPAGYQIVGKYDPKVGPRVEHKQIESKVDGNKLIGAHDTWIINGDGRWIKEVERE